MIISLYKYLLLENVKQAKKILTDKGINPEKEKDYDGIVKELKKLPNLISKFVKFRYEDGVDIDGIKRVMNWVVNNRQLVNKLPKNILEYDKFEHLEDDITKLNREQKIKKFYNSLYRSMKDQIDKLDEHDRDIFDNISLQFMNISEDERKQFTPLKYFEVNNITIEQFIEAINNFINKSSINSDKDSIIEKIKKWENSVDITYFKDNVLVIQTNNKEAVCDLGSQSWCIVYGSKSYAESYFGIKTYKSQYIVYNFKLPSSASNSMFGITINKDGIASYGGCQNKSNTHIPLDNIKELTGIPDGILIPAKRVLEASENYDKMINNIKKQKSIIKQIQILKDNDLIDYISKDDFSKITYDLNNHGVEVNNIISWLVNDINNYKNDNKIDELWKDYPEIFDFINVRLIFLSLNEAEIRIANIIYFVCYYYVKYNDEYKSKELLESIAYTKDIFDYFIDIKNNNKYKDLMKDLKSEELLDLLVKFINGHIDKYISNILNGKINNLTFEQYLEFFNKYANEKYEDFFDNYIYNIFFTYLDDDIFIKFIEKNINDYSISLTNIMDNNSYNGFDDSDVQEKENLIKLYEMKNEDDEYIHQDLNSLEKLFLYKNGERISKIEIEDELDIKRTKSGNTYVLFDSFTDFDDYFERNETPFLNLENNEPYYTEMGDSEVIDYLDWLDNDNIIDIAHYLYDNGDIEVKDLDKYEEIKTSNIEKAQELFNIIKKEVIDYLEEYDENDVDDILRCIHHAVDDLYGDLYYGEIHDKALNKVANLFGSTTLDNDERYYDWEYHENKEDKTRSSYKLMFSINIDDIIKKITFSNIYHNDGDNINWGSIIYEILEQTGKLSVDYDVYPWTSKNDNNQYKYFNERFSEDFQNYK